VFKSYGSANVEVRGKLTALNDFDEIFCCRKRKARGLKPPALTQRVLN
jgi:hypothetical protein